MPDLVPIRRALLSVSDKAGLVPFAKALAARGVELISTGGTATALAAAGLAVTPIERLTGFPEIMGGRVKTLHPKVHGGLLGVRDDPAHAEQMSAHGITPIDLVCVNLYPFERTVARPGCTEAEAVENIDIGGPSMLRSAGKNFEWVTVVTSPGQYDRVASEVAANKGYVSRRLRAELAAEAFAVTARYDASIAGHLAQRPASAFPQLLTLQYVKSDDLRYGENPHQAAAVYRSFAPPVAGSPTLPAAEQLHGKELSYNNLNDGAAALELVVNLRRVDPGSVAACVIKHTNPCGAALAPSASDAVGAAIAGDPVAAYGGIIALSDEVDAAAAERLRHRDNFFEVVIAPRYTPEALTMLRARWAHVRLMAVGEIDAASPGAPAGPAAVDYRTIPGGLLAQERNVRLARAAEFTHRAGPAPTPETLRVAAFLEAAAKFLFSNAIALGGPDGPAMRLLGAGAGQMDRLTSCRLAVEKAGPRAQGAVAFSDAFFPFADGPEVLIDAGVTTIVHAGGSKRDQETLDLCDRRGVTCLTTGLRHFRH